MVYKTAYWHVSYSYIDSAGGLCYLPRTWWALTNWQRPLCSILLETEKLHQSVVNILYHLLSYCLACPSDSILAISSTATTHTHTHSGLVLPWLFLCLWAVLRPESLWSPALPGIRWLSRGNRDNQTWAPLTLALIQMTEQVQPPRLQRCKYRGKFRTELARRQTVWITFKELL